MGNSSPVTPYNKDDAKNFIRFTSPREKRLWFFAALMLVTIFSTLVIGRPLIDVLRDQNIQALIFLVGMAIIGASMVLYGWIRQPSILEWVVLLGMVAVYILFILRLGLAERSHLIEYSALALCIHLALAERVQHRKPMFRTSLLAFAITFGLGLLDECIQLWIPDRVFDKTDILFNGLAAALAIGAIVIMRYIRKAISKRTDTKT